MELTRIRPVAPAQLCGDERPQPGMPGEEGLPPDLVGLRQLYLDALQMPAAVVALDMGKFRTVAGNVAFGRIVKNPAAPDFQALAHLVQTFFLTGRERQECAWQESGVGGRHFRIHLSRLPGVGELTERAMLCLVDRTAEIETERSLRAEMLRDSLTGLPNRTAFDEAVEVAIEHNQGEESFAVLAIDLARFSRVNECMGSLAGDELILTVASRLVAALREGDMLARMAGDEFGVLLRLENGERDALNAAQRLEATLSSPIRLSDLEIRVDCAIGGALWNERACNAGDLMRNAQVALKRAKRTGQIELYRRGEVNDVRRRFILETELRRAIEADELSLAFQPLINLESGTVSGFEALARWTHPDLGPISPSEFITVAEDSGLIVPLGRWALDAAARTLASWDARTNSRLPIGLAVNVSAVQLARDAVDQVVDAVLATNGIEGDRLTLELTESSIVADPERTNHLLGALHQRGVRVAMDDFGTGYSSLAYLQKLPIHVLKIDRSFVTDMHENRDSVAIIRAILSLARALGMSTTAEGIETADAARTLGALGCTTGQGYHFAKPLLAEDALAYFLSRNA